jgi:hypothetical protein
MKAMKQKVLNVNKWTEQQILYEPIFLFNLHETHIMNF